MNGKAADMHVEEQVMIKETLQKAIMGEKSGTMYPWYSGTNLITKLVHKRTDTGH